jgi:hypothetical protein
MRAKVEDLTVQAGLQIRRAILENEVTHRVGPRIGPSCRRLCAPGGSSRVTWSLLGRRSRWSDHGYERAKVRKWNWRATVSCSKTKTATSGAGTHGGGVVHAELSASNRECHARLGDREEQRGSAVRRGQQQSEGISRYFGSPPACWK